MGTATEPAELLSGTVYGGNYFICRIETCGMETTERGILGVQLTLVGLLLVVFFEGVFPYPFVGLLLGVVGTAIVLTALLSNR